MNLFSILMFIYLVVDCVVPASVTSPIISEYCIFLIASLTLSRLLLTVFLIIKSSIPNTLFTALAAAALTAPASLAALVKLTLFSYSL